MSALVISDIHKSFGKTDVLQGITLEIKSGEFVVFVGPSGCGKSTLLRIIAGLEEPTKGSISLNGAVIDHLPPAKRSMAMVFQTYALYPHLNVRDNMGLGLKQSGVDKASVSTQVSEAAQLLQLTDFLDQRPAQLSGGQRQRVAIGRAIVREPQLFLFDEPLSNLDAGLRANTRLEIARLHHKLKATMVYVTHDQTEAMTLADRIVVLNQGRIEQVGTPMELYRQPATQFVARFIGSPSMNLLDAQTLDSIDTKSATTVGIRPEHVAVSTQAGRWPAQVIHTENLGPDTIVYLDCDKRGTLIAHLFGEHDYAPDSQVFVDINTEQLHCFDADGSRQSAPASD